MFTRCPGCDAVYELQPRELAEAAGVVRCSNCGKTFNSLAALFAHQPEEFMKPLRGIGMPPLLGHRIYMQHEIPGLDDAPPEPESGIDEAEDATAAAPDEFFPVGQPRIRSRAWTGMAAALLLILAGQLIWLFDAPARWPVSGNTPDRVAPGTVMTVVSRDLHAHPSLREAVIVSATLRNQASIPVDLPILELRLYDSSNQILGVRRFQPEEYLPRSRRNDDQLSPGLDLPVILEVMVTGSQPSGFEFRFL